MYTVHTRETPALPRRGIICSVIAFGFTLAAAWSLTAQRQALLPLGDLIEPTDWAFAFQVPIEFEAIDAAKLERDIWKGERRFTRKIDDITATLAVGYRVYSPGMPLLEAIALLLHDRISGSEDSVSIERQTAAANDIDGLLGIQLSTNLKLRDMDYEEFSFTIGHSEIAATVLPNGTFVYCELTSEGKRDRPQSVIRSVAQSIRIHGRHRSSDTFTPAVPGLTCTMPEHAACVSESTRNPSAITFVSAADAEAMWHISAAPTFLYGSRTIGDLIKDHLCDIELRSEPRTTIRSGSVAGRETRHAIYAPGRLALVVMAVELDEGKAAVISAQCASEDAELTVAVCREIAGKLRVDGKKWPFDPFAAHDRAAEFVTHIHRRGVRELLNGRPAAESFTMQYSVDRTSIEHFTLNLPEATDAPVTGTYERTSTVESVPWQVIESHWQLDSHASGYELRDSISQRESGALVELRSVVARRSATDSLELTTQRGREKHNAELPSDPAHLADPLLQYAISHIAMHPQSGDHMFATPSISTSALSRHYIKPLPSYKDGDATLYRAMVYLDRNPEPIEYVFGEDGLLIQTLHDELRIKTRLPDAP